MHTGFVKAYYGCIQSLGRVLGSIPKLVKSLAKHGGTQDYHAVERRAGPAHPRTGQALFELFNATFHATGANRETCGTELGILHPAGMFAEVIGKVMEGVAVEGLKDKMNFAFEEQGFEVCCPALGSQRVVGKTGLSSFSQMLAGMKPIHDLYRTREGGGAQAPNPGAPT